jgi:hypothetical protein
MISGREALGQLEQAITSARSDESRLDAALASATDTAARARAEQADAFRGLARVRLDALAGSSVVGRIDAVEREALDLLAEKRKALAEVVAARKAATEALGAGQATRQGHAARLEEIAERIGALSSATKARISADPAWIAADAKVRDAEAMVKRAEAKTAQAETDRATKGAPYEADRLFMYLWSNGWGTSAYGGGLVTRFFDAKVAKVCGFIEARPNYAMLVDLPVRLKGHATGLAQDADTVRAARTAIERAALVADGIEKLEAEFAAVKAEIDDGNKGIASVQNDLATLDASHAALASGDDPQIARALDEVARSLAATDLQTLYRDAYATPTPDDEAIVRHIDELAKTVAGAEADIVRIRETIRQTAARRADLEENRDRFQRSGYDRPGVTFGNDQLLGSLIGGVIGGIVSSPDLWRAILGGASRSNHGSGDVFGGGPRIPGGGDWFGGGSSSGGSSGGFGGDGGGFTTGGGFGGDGDNSTGGGF